MLEFDFLSNIRLINFLQRLTTRLLWVTPPPKNRSMTAFWHVYTSFLLLYLTRVRIFIISDFLKLCNIYFLLLINSQNLIDIHLFSFTADLHFRNFDYISNISNTCISRTAYKQISFINFIITFNT